MELKGDSEPPVIINYLSYLLTRQAFECSG